MGLITPQLHAFSAWLTATEPWSKTPTYPTDWTALPITLASTISGTYFSHDLGPFWHHLNDLTWMLSIILRNQESIHSKWVIDIWILQWNDQICRFIHMTDQQEPSCAYISDISARWNNDHNNSSLLCKLSLGWHYNSMEKDITPLLTHWSYVFLALTHRYDSRPDSRFAPSQWETSLHSNVVSHWLVANLESAMW